MKDNLWWKMTFDERWLLMEDNLWWKPTFDGLPPSMEDVLRWKTIFDGRQLQRKMDAEGQSYWAQAYLNWSSTLKTKFCFTFFWLVWRLCQVCTTKIYSFFLILFNRKWTHEPPFPHYLFHHPLLFCKDVFYPILCIVYWPNLVDPILAVDKLVKFMARARVWENTKIKIKK